MREIPGMLTRFSIRSYSERAYLVREILRIARELGMVIPFYSQVGIWLLHGEATVLELRKLFGFLCGKLIKREGEL